MASRDKIIAKAEKLVSKGKIESAISEYEKVLKESPNDVNTLNRLGDLWVRAQKPEEAVRVFGQIADHYSRDGFFLKSIAIYKKINKLDPSNLDIYGKLAELYAKQGLAMEAKSQYMVLADSALKQGNNAQALATFRKIAELDPNSIQVHVKLADLYKISGETEKALEQYDKVGGMLLRKGMTDEAVQVYEKALKIDSNNLDLIASLTGALTEAGQPKEALKIIESARKDNPDNPKLAAVYGKALVESGDVGGAQSVLEEAVAMAPDDDSAREALGEVYLAQGNGGKAFEILDPVIQSKAGAGKTQEAIAFANQVLEVDDKNIGVLERVVDVYEQANEETNIITSLNALAEAHMAREENDSAAQVLERILEREPANEQIKQKLEMVRGGEAAPAPAPEEPAEEEPAAEEPAAEEPPAEEPAAEEAPAEIELDEEPAIEIDTGPSIELDEGPEIDLDDSEGIDLEAVSDEEPASATTPVEAPEPPSMAEELGADEDLTDDELTFIAEHMTEAEVFAKYGLVDRAVDHLEQVLTSLPEHLPAYEKLMSVYLDEGSEEKASAAAAKYIAKLRERGDETEIGRVEELLGTKGISVDAAAAPAGEAAVEVEPEPAEEAAIEVEPEPAEEAAVEIEPEPAEEEVSLEIEEEPAAEEVSLEIETEEEGVSIDVEEETPEEVSLEIEEPPAEELAAADADIDLDDVDLDDVELSFDEEEPAEEEPAEEAAATVTSGGEEAVAVDAPEVPVEEPKPVDHAELSEIDFYITEQLFSEARNKLSEMEARHPGAPELAERKEKIEEGEKAAAEEQEEAGATPAALDIESELSTLLPDDEAPVTAEAETAPAEQQAAAQPAEASVDEEGLFDDEDDFFDLAAELEQELGEDLDEDFDLAEEEQSLEDVFREFKKGVEEQLDSEDYDTHYNLGIAYKEMGLIDEAIGEFQIASKDPGRAVECCSMLGLCFLEKGMPQLAVKWYQKGIEYPEVTEDEHLGLLYELANAYEQIGDPAQAHKTFVEIYGVNSNYRDVGSRIKQLDGVT